MPLDKEQEELVNNLRKTSLFRLVSTGVDIDNRIRCATSVQIQNVEANGFLIIENAKYKIAAGAENDKKLKNQKEKSKDVLSKADTDKTIKKNEDNEEIVQRSKTNISKMVLEQDLEGKE